MKMKLDNTRNYSEEALSLRQNVLGWLETMRLPETPGCIYRLNNGADPSVYASCFAIFLRHLFADLDQLNERERMNWLVWLQGFQDKESGLFKDKGNELRAPDESHDTEHLNRQLTTFCLSAIDVLGGKPRYELSFLEKWKDTSSLTSWLNGLNWKNPWNCGNKVMFMAVFLSYAWKFQDDLDAKRALDVWFDWHNSYQNPKTGFWGEGFRSHYMDGLGGAYHQYVIYNYAKRPIAYADQIVERTLFLQQIDGMFYPYLGGASCNDLDAVETLIHFYLQGNTRSEEIRSALRKVYNGIWDMQNEDGGFCWARRRTRWLKGYIPLLTDIFRHRDLLYWYLSWRSAIRIQTLPNPTIKTGWASNARGWEDSSIFDTWFRCLTIAEISKVLTDVPYAQFPWQFLRVPGLGWFSDDI